MSQTQSRRLGATIFIAVALMAYVVVARDLDAQDASPTGSQSILSGTSTVVASQLGACAAQELIASPEATPVEAMLTLTGLAIVSYDVDDTLTAGIWELTPGASLEIVDGTRALVRISNGSVDLTVCGGDGVFDATEGDGETSSLTEGESQSFTSPSQVYLELDESSGTFRITGTSVDETALVWIEVANAMTDTIVCDGISCWGHSDATPIAPNVATPGAGCGSVRCWSP
jgi:hypothetical protein